MSDLILKTFTEEQLQQLTSILGATPVALVALMEDDRRIVMRGEGSEIDDPTFVEDNVISPSAARCSGSGRHGPHGRFQCNHWWTKELDDQGRCVKVCHRC